MISVTHKERLRSGSVRLDQEICSSDLVDEARISDVGKTTDEIRAGVGIDTRQRMLPQLEMDRI